MFISVFPSTCCDNMLLSSINTAAVCFNFSIICSFDFFDKFRFLFLPIPILNSLCNVCPPTLCAAAPVGAATITLLLSWKNFLMYPTTVLINTLFPLPAHPTTVIHSGLNCFLSLSVYFSNSTHSFNFRIIT
jgi:hypothetical protein